jgi:hypothetical protein
MLPAAVMPRSKSNLTFPRQTCERIREIPVPWNKSLIKIDQSEKRLQFTFHGRPIHNPLDFNGIHLDLTLEMMRPKYSISFTGEVSEMPFIMVWKVAGDPISQSKEHCKWFQ